MKIIISCLLILISTLVIGQENNKIAKILTKDGTSITGKVLINDSKNVTVETAYGEIKVLRDNIKSIEYLDEKDPESDEINEDPDKDYYSASHYLYGQSAFGLKKGQSYYENTYLFLNSFTYGVTDNFSIGVGTEIISILTGNFPLTYITPKLSFPFKGGAASIGTTLINFPFDGESNTAGLLSGALTIGSLRSNLTFGAGLGYTFQEGFEDSFVPISISGSHRISDRVAILSENIFITGEGSPLGILSAGVRIYSRSETNFLTISLLRPTEGTDSLIAWPFFSGTIKIK